MLAHMRACVYVSYMLGVQGAVSLKNSCKILFEEFPESYPVSILIASHRITYK